MHFQNGKKKESLTESCRRAVEMFRIELIDKVFRSSDHSRLFGLLERLQAGDSAREREREGERQGGRGRGADKQQYKACCTVACQGNPSALR